MPPSARCCSPPWLAARARGRPGRPAGGPGAAGNRIAAPPPGRERRPVKAELARQRVPARRSRRLAWSPTPSKPRLNHRGTSARAPTPSTTTANGRPMAWRSTRPTGRRSSGSPPDFPSGLSRTAHPRTGARRMAALLLEDVAVRTDEQVPLLHVRFPGPGRHDADRAPPPDVERRPTWPAVLTTIDALLAGATDAEVAALLNAQGLTTGPGSAPPATRSTRSAPPRACRVFATACGRRTCSPPRGARHGARCQL